MVLSIRLFLKKIIYYIIITPHNLGKVVVSGFSSGLQNVEFEGENKVSNSCNFSGKIKIGYATTLGSNNFLHGDIEIGKYCQLGADIGIHTTNHPTSYLSTYINKTLFNGEISKLKTIKKTVICNDVWIGHNAIIVGGVRIGNGAIIAAGSVVTKDVKPYSIVAGTPSKLIRFRFSETVIEEIEKLKWWKMNSLELEKNKHLFLKDFKNCNSIYS